MLIRIVTGDSRPIFKQIVDDIVLKIKSGEVPPGAKLPSVRALARQLLINNNTVARAYTELSSMGLVEARKGRGLFVGEPRQRLSQSEQQKQLEDAIALFTPEVAVLDFTSEQVLEQVARALASVKADSRGNEND